MGGAACHEESGVTVKSLHFKGNSAFDSARLTAVLATRSSGWFPWSTRHYFDRTEFETDLKRVQSFYADRGYPSARVSGINVDLNQARDAVDLTITIDEGAPLLIQTIRFEGFEDLPSGVRPVLDDLPLKAGQPRDRELVRESRDLGARLLSNLTHSAGNARAEMLFRRGCYHRSRDGGSEHRSAGADVLDRRSVS